MFYLSDDDKFELTAQDKALLKQMVITNDFPGTILRDFQTLLDYVQEYEVAVSKNYLLPLKVLEPINGRLTRPIRHGLTRPTQKSLPNVSGLYMLLRTAGLAFVDASGRKPILKLDELALTSWQSLNPTEQYFTLLESWLLRGSAELLGEDSGYSSFHNPVIKWHNFQASLWQPNWPNIEGNLVEALKYGPGLHNLALMELFGLMVVIPGRPVEKKGWQITAVEPTQFGTTLLKCLIEIFFGSRELSLYFHDATEASPGQLQPFLQPYFPQWQNNIQWSEILSVSGTYTFRVSLSKSIWRRLVIDADASLEELGAIILQAFKFDNDHLHRFTYRSRLGTLEGANHSYMDEGPFTSDVSIGAVPLPIGGTMDFHFDFGDDWHFEVKLESVEEGSKELNRPKILESHGKAPEQYPSYDDEW